MRPLREMQFLRSHLRLAGGRLVEEVPDTQAMEGEQWKRLA